VAQFQYTPCWNLGLLAAGIFTGGPGQFIAQLVGVATLLGFILPMTYSLNWLLGRIIAIAFQRMANARDSTYTSSAPMLIRICRACGRVHAEMRAAN